MSAVGRSWPLATCPKADASAHRSAHPAEATPASDSERAGRRHPEGDGVCRHPYRIGPLSAYKATSVAAAKWACRWTVTKCRRRSRATPMASQRPNRRVRHRREPKRFQCPRPTQLFRVWCGEYCGHGL